MSNIAILVACAAWIAVMFLGVLANRRIRQEQAKDLLKVEIGEVKDVLLAALASGDVHLRDKVKQAVELLDELKPISGVIT